MTQEPLTLYKLIVLYMLDQVDFPLTTAQISEFILEQGYTNYLTLQQALSELTEAGLVDSQTVRNRTRLTNTKEGAETLRFFGNRISDAIKEDVKNFLLENKAQLKNDYSITSNYYKSVSGEYEAQLMAKEKDVLLMDLRISVPTKELAEDVCLNWKKRNEEVYRMLTQMLF